MAEQYGVPRYRSPAELLEQDRPDGVVLATPNQAHVDGGLECVAAGVPTLVEEPFGDTVEAAARLVEVTEAAGVPLLTGHHRPSSPIPARARHVVDGGVLGRVVAVVGTALPAKPADYSDVGGDGRRQPGGGPVLIDLVHEVDGPRWLVGDAVRVQATTSNAARDCPAEDTAAVLLTIPERGAGHLPALRRGCLAPVLGADLAGGPQLPEPPGRGLPPRRRDRRMPVGPHDAATRPARCALVGGAVRHPRRGGRAPRLLAGQVEHFAAVVRGEAEPVCSGRDGLATLEVVDAVVRSPRTGEPVDLPGAGQHRRPS